MKAHLVAFQQVQKFPQPDLIALLGHHIAFDIIARSELSGFDVKILLVGEEFRAQAVGADHAGDRGSEMFPDVVAVGSEAIIAVALKGARAARLEQHADRAVDHRVGRAGADVKIVEGFLGVVKALLGIERFGRSGGPVAHQIKGRLGHQRIGLVGDPGVEVVGLAGAHFVVVD